MPSRDIVLDLPLRITRTANQQRTYQYCYDYHRKVKGLHLKGMTTFAYPALMGFATACSIPIRLCPSSVLPAKAGIHSCFDAWAPASAGATRNAPFPRALYSHARGVLRGAFAAPRT